jgi:predicted deacylase
MPRPGKETEYLAVGADDEAVQIPVATLTGESEGPTLLVVAGVHGSEYAGIEATSRLFRWVDPSRLQGALVTVPCLNVPAFYSLSMHINPRDGKNLGDSFPGDRAGTITDRIACAVFDSLVSKADFVLDVHGGDLEEELVEYSQINLTGNEKVDRAAEALARALDMPMFLRSPVPASPPSRGSLFAMASKEGKPGVLLEAGSHGLLEEFAVTAPP